MWIRLCLGLCYVNWIRKLELNCKLNLNIFSQPLHFEATGRYDSLVFAISCDALLTMSTGNTHLKHIVWSFLLGLFDQVKQTILEKNMHKQAL